jgi:hypothetical protein
MKQLIGAALDYAVALAENDDRDKDAAGVPLWYNGDDDAVPYAPSQLWEHGGHLVEQARVNVRHVRGEWRAVAPGGPEISGATALQAAMRAYVAARSGQTVEIPEGLV